MQFALRYCIVFIFKFSLGKFSNLCIRKNNSVNKIMNSKKNHIFEMQEQQFLLLQIFQTTSHLYIDIVGCFIMLFWSSRTKSVSVWEVISPDHVLINEWISWNLSRSFFTPKSNEIGHILLHFNKYTLGPVFEWKFSKFKTIFSLGRKCVVFLWNRPYYYEALNKWFAKI